MNHLLDRITVDNEICQGKACIRHMRWPVEIIVDLIASGMSFEEILTDHPELEKEDILAALMYNENSNLKDFWNDLPDRVQAGIELARNQAAEGKLTLNNEALKKYAKYL